MKQQSHPAPTKFASACDMPYFDLCTATMEWNETGTWRYLRPRYAERIPACQGSCPTANDIERWIRHLEKGEAEKAYEAATVENPFPAIMGRVCFHPCMDGCNRKELGGAVNINMLERTLGDAMNGKLPPAKPFFHSSGKKIAVVGAGPAGLAFAYHAARLGHKVAVFEREKKAGGMLRYGIPSYRLPKKVLDLEISRLEEMGVEFKFDRGVRDAAATQDLKRDFDAVFLAIGAHKSKALKLGDEKASGVMSGLEFLKSFESGRSAHIGKKVIVVGGGNTAIDAARTARRLGSDVKIVYRRGKAEMPASEEEVREAEAEGVVVEILTAPVSIITKDKRATGVICRRMELGEPDESGRRRPVPVEGSDTSIDADTILTAIGEDIETGIIPSSLRIDEGSLYTKTFGRTEWTNVFAGGDLIKQQRTVVDALNSGKKAAIAVDCMLRGDNIESVLSHICVPGSEAVFISRYVELRSGKAAPSTTTSETDRLSEVVKFEDLNSAYFTESKPNATPKLPMEHRFGREAFAEVGVKPPEETQRSELSRCFHCGRCTECDNCYIYCPDVAIAKKEGGFAIDLFFCKGCGVCSEECPRAAMRMIEEPMEL